MQKIWQWFFKAIIAIGIGTGSILIFIAVLISGNNETWREIFAFVVAEIGAVLIATSLIHFVYEMTMMKGLKALKSLKLQGLTKYHRTLSNDTLRKLLAKSKNITVVKTWFPENDHLKEGLISSLKANGQVNLFLLDPNSEILKKRSEAASPNINHGKNHVHNAICLMYDWKFIKPLAPVVNGTIGIYDYWPGSPLIQLDNSILMGFYWIGDSSPAFPWLEIKNGSYLHDVLKGQIMAIKEKSELLETKTQFENFARRKEIVLHSETVGAKANMQHLI